MEYRRRENPLFSACGLNCGLCPRHYTHGASKCPGCAGEGFSSVHPSCGVLSCCQSKGFEYCFLCGEFPCKKYNGADLSDSFITHKHQFLAFEKAKQRGIEAYTDELNKKIEILELLLDNYNDGRRKSFFCTAVNLLDLRDAELAIDKIKAETEKGTPIKAKAAAAVRVIGETADKMGISLKLRKKGN